MYTYLYDFRLDTSMHPLEFLGEISRYVGREFVCFENNLKLDNALYRTNKS